MFGFDADTWKVFNVVIQLGAILAVVVQYWRTFWAVGTGLLRLEKLSIAFTRNVLLAFLPSVVIGLAAKKYIDVLLGSPMVVCWALVIGGVAILAIERVAKPGPASGIGQLPARQALGVGFMQCLAMIPGVSRSGATIMGALAMGIERRTAAEFSFFLAVPTMLGATVLELHDNKDALMHGAGPVGWSESFLRWFIQLLAWATCTFVLLYLTPYWDKSGRRQGLHDRVAGTLVVKLPPR